MASKRFYNVSRSETQDWEPLVASHFESTRSHVISFENISQSICTTYFWISGILITLIFSGISFTFDWALRSRWFKGKLSIEPVVFSKGTSLNMTQLYYFIIFFGGAIFLASYIISIYLVYKMRKGKLSNVADSYFSDPVGCCSWRNYSDLTRCLPLRSLMVTILVFILIPVPLFLILFWQFHSLPIFTYLIVKTCFLGLTVFITHVFSFIFCVTNSDPNRQYYICGC